MTSTVLRKELAVMASHSINGEHMGAKELSGQSGFTYIGVLIAVALMGIGLLAISEVWTTTARRQKMAQLDWIGEQYVQAIESYYYANTGSVHFYPDKLDDLVEDKRYLSIKRHIRTLYANPFTNTADWKIIPSAQGGIQGIEYKRVDSDYLVCRQFVFVPRNEVGRQPLGDH